MKLKCCVIDDDPLICDLIQHFCSKVPEIDFCLAAGTALEGLSLLTTQSFDLLFLDYNLPDMTGKALLERKPEGVAVVMITSERDFAIESYDYVDIIDYIVKPIAFGQFYRAVERVLASQVKTNETAPPTARSMFVKDGTKLVQLHFDEISHIKSESNYVFFYLSDRHIMSLMSLKDLITKLPKHFVRIHRSYIVNTHKINYIATDDLSIGDKTIPIGSKYKEELMNLIANS